MNRIVYGPTGNKRFRKSLFGKLILQEEIEVCNECWHDYSHSPSWKEWRDAKFVKEEEFKLS